MKACFLLQRRFAYVGHAMALTFKKKYGIKEFCGYVYLRESLKFLKSQKDISYTKLLLDEDVHKQYKNEPLDLGYLKNLEKEYGIPNLWPHLSVDRIIRYNLLVRDYPYDTPKYSHEEMMRITQVTAKAIIKFLDEEKPDFVFFPNIAFLGSMLLYHIAKKRNIKTFVVRHSGISKKYTFTENYIKLDLIDNAFDEISKNSIPYQEYTEKAEKFLVEFRNKPAPYSKMASSKAWQTNRQKQFAFLLPHKILKSIKWFAKMSYMYFTDKNHDDYSNVKPWYYLLDRTKRKIRVLIGFDKFHDRVDFNEDFVLFPLQFQPEVSTLLYAPFYIDQLWLIKQIARSLPIHFKLYVKEHPRMFGYRPRKFYKELKKIPNVKLIEPSVANFDLIKNAKLTTMNTGTAGWEATLLKKPVITFGEAFYNKLSFIKRCRSIENLPNLIKKQLENFNYDEKLLINYVAAIYKESAEVDLVQLWSVEGGDKMNEKEKGVTPLVNLIAKKLGLNPIDNT